MGGILWTEQTNSQESSSLKITDEDRFEEPSLNISKRPKLGFDEMTKYGLTKKNITFLEGNHK